MRKEPIKTSASVRSEPANRYQGKCKKDDEDEDVDDDEDEDEALTSHACCSNYKASERRRSICTRC